MHGNIKQVINDVVINDLVDSARSARLNLSETVGNTGTALLHRMFIQHVIMKFTADKRMEEYSDIIRMVAFILGRAGSRYLIDLVLSGKDNISTLLKDETMNSFAIFIGESVFDPMDIGGPYGDGSKWKIF
jgi:hypothetical protein